VSRRIIERYGAYTRYTARTRCNAAELSPGFRRADGARRVVAVRVRRRCRSAPGRRAGWGSEQPSASDGFYRFGGASWAGDRMTPSLTTRQASPSPAPRRRARTRAAGCRARSHPTRSLLHGVSRQCDGEAAQLRRTVLDIRDGNRRADDERAVNRERGDRIRGTELPVAKRHYAISNPDAVTSAAESGQRVVLEVTWEGTQTGEMVTEQATIPSAREATEDAERIHLRLREREAEGGAATPSTC
jgi:hypothetical protein